MVIFGLLLLIVGILGLLSGLFASDYDVDGKDRRTTEILGINVDPEILFLLGAIAGALILVGLWFMKMGAKRGWARRQENKRYQELSEKLDRAEADRRSDDLSGREES